VSPRTLLAAAIFAVAIHAPASAQQQLPRALDSYKPHEIVEAVISEATPLALTTDQARRLDELHVTVRDERHRWAPISGSKAHVALRMAPMISQEEAYRGALAVLTAAQREKVEQTFAATNYVPTIPSLATAVPPSLDGLQPHQIVEAVLAERGSLKLSEDQARDLDALHRAVRDEPHRYIWTSHGPKGPGHLMMAPMISKRRAYNDALSYLTPEQRSLAVRRFREPGYRIPQQFAGAQ
jgi:hypothetical protein